MPSPIDLGGPAIFDAVVDALEQNGGVATVSIPSILESIPALAFSSARRALNEVKQNPDIVSHIPEGADSGHVTGFHSAGGLSAYNVHREGFVFSDGGTIQVKGIDDFGPSTLALFTTMQAIADGVLNAIERRLSISERWFQSELGPTDAFSQWHIKRYVKQKEEETDTGAAVEKDGGNESLETKEKILLPMHTDPSIISVVIHDMPGSNSGGLGLQYSASVPGEDKRVWTEVEQHGHCVATIFVGSVLSHITGRKFPAVKHRVVDTECVGRMAATLFVRPRGDSILQVPPSALLEDVTMKKQVTFDTWNSRVSKNYMKKKQKAKPATAAIENDLPPDYGYYKDEYTEMNLIPCNPPLKGPEKFLGGEIGNNGKIYTVPGHAPQVMVIDPTQDPPACYPIGPKFKGEFKWLRGVRANSGIIYAIPCHADSVLRIDPETDEVSTIAWDYDDPMSPPKGLPWKWHGGNISTIDNCLYCIPQFAETILKLDTVTEKISFFGGPFPGRNKFYGGLVGKDNAIYGICQNSTGVLRIDVEQQTAKIHGSFPEGGYKWHGGVADNNGDIYGIPAHADSVLKIVPGPDPVITTIGGPLRTGAHRTDGKYKYLGGSVGHDGNVYFFPSDADYVLQTNPTTGVVREVGPNLRDLEPLHNNKWQNGFTLSDGSIFGIPLKAKSIVRIRTFRDGREPDVTTIGGPYDGLNKWEGGTVSKDGRMFCMPLNANHVLQIKDLTGNQP